MLDIDEADESLADLVGQRVGILYSNAQGDESEREVTVNAITRRDTGVVLKCFCHVRKAPRFFRLDRVQSVYDVETGEILGDGESFAKTYAPPEAKRPTPSQVSAAARVAAAISAVRAEMHVLIFLARCDGWHNSEVSVACNFVLDDAPADIDIAELERQVRRLDPDMPTFREALARFERADSATANRLVRSVRRLVAADGALSDDEWKLVDEMSAFVERELGG